MRHLWKPGLPALVVVAWCLAGAARAEPLGQDPVDQLRKGLKATEDLRAGIRRTSLTDEQGMKKAAEQLKTMEGEVEKQAGQVRTIGELRRALQLRELTNIPLDRGDADFNQRIWNQLAKEFFKQVEQALQDRANPLRELAAVNLLSEMATAAQTSILESAQLQDELAKRGNQLADLIRPDADPQVREAAIRALGKVNPDQPDLAAKTLHRVLFDRPESSAADRRAAAEALGNLIRGLMQSLNNTRGLIRSARVLIGNPRKGQVEQLRQKARALAEAIGKYVDEAGQALLDSDTAVRRLAMAAFQQVAIGLKDLDVPLRESTETDEEYQKELDAGWETLLPLREELGKQSDALRGAINDPDVEVRTMARRTAENLATARQKLLHPASFVPPTPAPPPGPPSMGKEPTKQQSRRPADAGRRDVTATAAADPADEDPLQRGLDRLLGALAQGLTDPDVMARLAAVGAIEALGKEATPVAPDLVRTLADCNLFVRWAAARTLGEMAQGEAKPVAAATAVPGLVRLLNDPDMDVRLTAALSLGRYGPAALDAAPALARAVTDGDVEMRLAAITALEGIGTNAAGTTIPVLTRALAGPDPRLQRAAAHSLARYADAGRDLGADAIAALRQALNDPDPDVRRLASDALLSAGAPRQKK